MPTRSPSREATTGVPGERPNERRRQIDRRTCCRREFILPSLRDSLCMSGGTPHLGLASLSLPTSLASFVKRDQLDRRELGTITDRETIYICLS